MNATNLHPSRATITRKFTTWQLPVLGIFLAITVFPNPYGLGLTRNVAASRSPGLGLAHNVCSPHPCGLGLANVPTSAIPHGFGREPIPLSTA